MPWIKATDIAYGRFRAPDLDVMEEFLTHFGLVRAERTPDRALHARHRSAPSPPRHREGRPEVRRLRLPRRERGRPQAARQGARRLRRSRTSTSPAAASACA